MDFLKFNYDSPRNSFIVAIEQIKSNQVDDFKSLDFNGRLIYDLTLLTTEWQRTHDW